MKYFLIVDTHNGGINSENKILSKLQCINRYIQKSANMTIVTNDNLAKIIENNGGSPFVLPDRIPDDIEVNKIPLQGKFKFVFICTFSADEPIAEVLNAARFLDVNDRMYITGDFYKADQRLLRNLCDSITLTGFLKDADYWGLLKEADCIIDLTLRNDCLVCGAYEAIAVGTPMILSDTEVSRATFSKGAIFTQNDTQSIISALKMAKLNNIDLKKEIVTFRNEFISGWEVNGYRLKNLIKQKAAEQDSQ